MTEGGAGTRAGSAAGTVQIIPEGEVVFGIQLPIQSQSTIYVEDWELGPAPPSSPGWRARRRRAGSSTWRCATTPPSRAGWPGR